jgi:hypothetical protein
VTRAMELEHEPPAHHVAQRAVGLDPAPGATQPLGECATTLLGMRRDQRTDERNVGDGDGATAIAEHGIHGRRG